MSTVYARLSDVISHLNLVAVGSGGTSFTVYGLPVATSSVQAHVDHANKRINALLGQDLDPSDYRYASAELAALDLACLGVLVVSVGGSLVGAFDFTLADLHVGRAGPYAYAIKAAIDAYREDAIANIQNILTVASGARAEAAERVPRYNGSSLNP